MKPKLSLRHNSRNFTSLKLIALLKLCEGQLLPRGHLPRAQSDQEQQSAVRKARLA